ncbi:MAG: hypothetical protein R3D45_13740 [Rhizobiaceae bacterium]
MIGIWQSGTSIVRITADGWYFSVSNATPYLISPDGATLQYPSTGTVTEYNRTLGAGVTLVGVWQRTENDGPDIWLEELHFRDNGTYTFQWSLNGVFESEGMGNYIAYAATIDSEERRALLETQAPDTITFDPLYAPNEVGTYQISADENLWTYFGPSGTFVYTRIS